MVVWLLVVGYRFPEKFYSETREWDTYKRFTNPFVGKTLVYSPGSRALGYLRAI
ncbi:MAG: hypothetical protein K8L97_32230 [Anaerolineae bacterium]|nr:hypothetical protein [Anaerolineae bacterium]